ncbi:MAG: type II toxin-antitoxin system PemK/MazF family toxin [Thiotrichaceae bacterium]
MSFDAFSVVVVPFPFTDRATSKRRPALVLSDKKQFNQPIGHSVLAMITSAKQSAWPLDQVINNLDAAGLPSPSLVRMKLFTLDDRLILRQIGELSDDDKTLVGKQIKQLFYL